MRRSIDITSVALTAFLAACTKGPSASSPLAVPGTEATDSCPVTAAIRAEPPPDPNYTSSAQQGAGPVDIGPWYINADRTIWAGWDAARMKAGPQGNKVLWIRPWGTQLTVSGRRLDAEAPPPTASIPCCYPTGFQASGLTFPTEGCWEISAKAGNSQLTFVTRVGPEPPAR
jgi:hypothetical protein